MITQNENFPGWGPLDFSIQCKNTLITESESINIDFVVEWETGNVSSSHRSIDKMISTMYFSHVIGAVLIVPTKEFKTYLTDRVGNFEELEPLLSILENTSRKS